MFRRTVCLTSLCFFLVMAKGIRGATINWTDAGPDHLWSTMANWDNASGPTSADIVSINKAEDSGPTIANEVVEAKQLRMFNGLVTMEGGSLSTLGVVQVGRGTSGVATFNLNSGSVSCNTWFSVGGSTSGTLNMTGGTITVGQTFAIGNGNVAGDVHFDGGVINTNVLLMGAPCSMDITSGTLIIDGDVVSTVQGYIDNGWITGYGGAQDLILDYGVRNFEQTTLTAVPEPATMMLLGIGALGLLRRKHQRYRPGKYRV